MFVSSSVMMVPTVALWEIIFTTVASSRFLRHWHEFGHVSDLHLPSEEALIVVVGGFLLFRFQ